MKWLLSAWAVSGLFLLTPAGPAAASAGATLTAGQLRGLCTAQIGSTQAKSCQAYIQGVLDYHTLLRSMEHSPGVDFCVPDSITHAELQMVVGGYLNKEKQNDSFIAAPAVALALSENYPCTE